jgi:cytidine deaminase
MISNNILIEAANEARANSYAPYSKFAVGAALLTESGAVFRGGNVENASFGLTTCAEQAVVAAAITAGQHKFVRMVIVTDSDEPTLPCGRCRQVLAEFAPDLEVVAVTVSGKSESHRLSELLPRPFRELPSPP